MTKTNIDIEDRLHRKKDNQRGLNGLVILLAIISVIISISSCSLASGSIELESRIEELESETKLLKECLIETIKINQKALRLHQW